MDPNSPRGRPIFQHPFAEPHDIFSRQAGTEAGLALHRYLAETPTPMFPPPSDAEPADISAALWRKIEERVSVIRNEEAAAELRAQSAESASAGSFSRRRGRQPRGESATSTSPIRWTIARPERHPAATQTPAGPLLMPARTYYGQEPPDWTSTIARPDHDPTTQASSGPRLVPAGTYHGQGILDGTTEMITTTVYVDSPSKAPGGAPDTTATTEPGHAAGSGEHGGELEKSRGHWASGVGVSLVGLGICAVLLMKLGMVRFRRL